jgi:hypothetical protein
MVYKAGVRDVEDLVSESCRLGAILASELLTRRRCVYGAGDFAHAWKLGADSLSRPTN